MRLDYIDNVDCLEGMKEIPDGSVDMVLCDLPYGETKNKWDTPISLPALWAQYKRIVKPNGAILLHADGMFMARLMLSEPKMWRYNLVWDKVLTTGFLNAKRMPLRQTEEICVFYRKLPVYHPQMKLGKPNHSVGKAVGKTMKESSDSNHNYGEHVVIDNRAMLGNQKYPTSLLRFAKPHSAKVSHPTEKPVELSEWLIKTYSNPGDVVLDNCIGSGTTAVACVNTGRHYIGFETEKAYCETAQKRVADAVEKKRSLFDYMA